MQSKSSGTAGFLTTLVLTCAFAIIASAVWSPPQHEDTAGASDVTAAITPVPPQ